MYRLLQTASTFVAIFLIGYTVFTGSKKQKESLKTKEKAISYSESAREQRMDSLKVDYKRPMEAIKVIIDKFQKYDKSIAAQRSRDQILRTLKLKRVKIADTPRAPVVLCGTKVLLDVAGIDSKSATFLGMRDVKVVPGSLDIGLSKILKDAALLSRTGDEILIEVPDINSLKDEIVNVENYRTIEPSGKPKSGSILVKVKKIISRDPHKVPPALYIKGGLADSRVCNRRHSLSYRVYSPDKSELITAREVRVSFIPGRDFMQDYYGIFEYLVLSRGFAEAQSTDDLRFGFDAEEDLIKPHLIIDDAKKLKGRGKVFVQGKFIPS